MSPTAREVPAGARVGSVVGGKYRLVRLLGEGGMGEVYEAQHLVVGRRFALKFLHQHLSNHSDALTRFQREAQAAGALENEHIASVVDLDAAEDGAPFLVMEFLVGESVAQLLQREGPLPVARAVSIVLQVCRGLEAAHAAGIVHRDLKPDNLFSLRRADGTELIKILDFGIAKLVRTDGSPNLTHSGAMLGTPFYMAPEQARGEKLLDERVDIYAAGVILYELLSGEKPHPGDSHNSILAHILTEPITPLATLRSGLPSRLLSLIERTLSSSRDERPRSVTSLARELVPFAGREVLPIQSHFELRNDIASAKTLPTPDTHALSLPPEKVITKASAREPSRWPALLVVGILGVAGLVSIWFLRAKAIASSNVSASSQVKEPSAPPELVAPAPSGLAAPAPSLASSAVTAAASSSVASAAASAATSAAATSATPARRPSGRPKSSTSAAASASDEPASQPSKSSTLQDKSPSPRVNFDRSNPYQ